MVTGLAILLARISSPATWKMRRWTGSKKWLRLEEIGDPVERFVVDQDRAEERLFRLDVLRLRCGRSPAPR